MAMKSFFENVKKKVGPIIWDTLYLVYLNINLEETLADDAVYLQIIWTYLILYNITKKTNLKCTINAYKMSEKLAQVTGKTFLNIQHDDACLFTQWWIVHFYEKLF